ncbi:MAG TPA: hypothetical protein VIZ32_08445 [Vicinamibacterales bacterium]
MGLEPSSGSDRRFEEPMLFWAVLAVIVLIAPVTIALAKLWRWI